MRPVTVEDFASACGGSLVGVAPYQLITGFALDSRDVEIGDLFLAIKGDRHDGHDFAAQVVAMGATAVMAERPVPGPHILVENLVDALARFALTKRRTFSGPVIGITGSNGKTSTKEFTAAALASLGKVLKSPANKNTEYTSPLVWANLRKQKVAVIEMAMRGLGQIAHLASFTEPTIGVVTCVGTAHIEKVGGSREGIMRAKAELLEALPNTGTAIVWREDDFWSELCDRSAAPTLSFGFSQEADCRVVGYRSLGLESSVVRLSLDGRVVESKLPAIGRHQALNASAAMLAAHVAGASVEAAAEGLQDAHLPPMRLEVLAVNGATILLDTYNASPDSTVAAIQTLSELTVGGRRLAVLGEMRELGEFAESGHRMVGKALATAPVDRVFLTGGPTRFIADEATMAGYPSQNITSEEELDIEHVRRFLGELQEGDVVLIKGSRALGLERALEGLQ
ncbi:MAG: UDP-N-acetylmuramoyl-tripeptide--D-alanyl-D-alanine ligase [Armatimonadetes bacterium]|nr:UDP-N-acetylmuramoyl-tripeptide--D-alanyl-D-alanine ligase [Armatimonadota bacterium]